MARRLPMTQVQAARRGAQALPCWPAPLAMAVSAAFAPAAWAQAVGGETGAAARLPFTVVPSFSATQTYTRSDIQTPGEQRSELVTQLSPAVQVRSGSGRVRGYLNYALNTYTYARDADQNNVQHALSASVNAEAITNFAYVDASASVSQQLISPFGQQVSNNALNSANRTEVRSYTVSPYVRGSLNGVIDYEARASHSASRSAASAAPGNTADAASVQVSGGTMFSRLRWSVGATHQTTDFDAGRRNTTDRASVSLSYLLNPQLTLFANGGRESSNYVTIDKFASGTGGLGLAWRPSEVTSLVANIDHRPYGNTHALNFSHRSGRTAWTYTDTRSVSNGVAQPIALSLGTNYEVYYNLTSPNDPPALRQAITNAYLQALGIKPDEQAYASFLTSSLTLDRQQLLSAALQGVRDSVTLSFSRSSSSRLDKIPGVVDALSGSATIRQQGFSVNLGHRLTPTSSLNLNAGQHRVSAIDAVTGGITATRLRSVDLSWSDQIGRRTRASLTARRGVFDSATAPYTETALTAGLSLQF